MFTMNQDLSIYANRGDIVFFSVTADDSGILYKFQPGDIVRMSIYGKKDAETCVMQKDFPVTEVTEKVFIFLDEEDTKIGEIISKPKDYWYEIVLNPDTMPQTLIGYDEDGAKVFRLFPESTEIDDNYDPKPEDFPVVDSELDMTSPRPVSNSAIARAVATILDTCKRTNAAVAELHVTPQMFGAIGDGVADDTEAIQSAINSSMATGGVLYIPEGDYVITDTLKFSTMDNQEWEDVKNVRVYGAGSSRTILRAKMVDKPVLLYENVNNGNFSNALAEDFSILPYSGDYSYKFDGIKLVNAVGNIYRNIIVSLANTGILLTTKKDTSISGKNTGYTEQNVFEDVRVSAVKGIVFNAGENDLRASYHGNIFERVSVTANSNDTGKRSVAISLESGYIYNCTFNIKTFQGGSDSHLLYINTPCGMCTGTISYEDFTGYGVKISTGNLATAHFMLNGNIYGLGNIDWCEYRQCAVGDLDEDGNAVDENYTNIGRERLSCRNLIPPFSLTSISQDEKTYMSMPLYGGKEDDWSGDAHNLVRYRNKDGNTEHGYVMACKQNTYGRSRFIVGTVPEKARSLDDFVPGFEFFADGSKIKAGNNVLEFRENGIAANGSLVRRASDESYSNEYNGKMRFAGGLTVVWGAFEAPVGTNAEYINISSYGLQKAFNVQVTSFSVVGDGHKNYSSVSGLTNNGFYVHTDNTSKGLVYWLVFGHTA